MASEGMTSLTGLIRSMEPVLLPDIFVFGHIPAKTDADSQSVLRLLITLPVQMMFKETEGWTVITQQSVAEQVHLKYTFPCKQITLNVHSSLDAVGFMAKITEELAKLEIGCNPVSGYFHDHLLVPVGKEDAVMDALQRMTREA